MEYRSQRLNTTELLLSTLSAESLRQGPHITAPDVAEGVTLAAILLLSFIGNALVCYCGLTSTRGQAMNYFIVNSAFAEMLLAVLVLPLRVYGQFGGNSTVINSNLCRLLQYFETVALAVVNISLVLIAIDRYLSIFLAPRAKITLKKAKYLMVISWCLPMLSTSPIFLDLFGNSAKPGWIFLECDQNINKIYSLIQIAVVSILPMFVLSGTYFVMIARVLRIDATRKGRNSPSRKSPCGTSREEIPVAKRRALVMNFIVSSLFLFCWTPIVMLHAVIVVKGNLSRSEESLRGLLSYIALANLSFNPLVYCFFDSVFRNHVLCCLARKRAGLVSKSKEPLTENNLTELTVSKIGNNRQACADQEPLLTTNVAQPAIKPSMFSRDKLAKLVCNTRRYRSLGHSRCSEI